MKNRITKLSLFLLVGILAITGCKKGANDPFLSLLSRDARITGTWKLSAEDYTRITTYASSGTTSSSTVTNSYDGNIMTVVTPAGTTTYSYSWTITIDKDGTYSMTKIEDGTQDDYTGNWWWLEDTKDKTRIAFDDDVESYLIDQLKNKEMVLTQNTSYKTTNTANDYSETVITSTFTFTKE